MHVNVSPEWHAVSSEGVRCVVRGNAWHGNSYIRGKELADFFCGVAARNNQDTLQSVLRSLKGTFAAIIIGKRHTWLVADRIRSIPLFYAVAHGALYAGADRVNVRAVYEFLAAGYCLQARTLYEGLFQLMAGEYLLFDATEGTCSLVTYYRYPHHEQKEVDEVRLLARAHEAFLSAFKRLMSELEGRTAVVPLSGGIDSRLVAVMLKRLGHSPCVCISYGVPGNWESRISKRVAESLGMKWIFVPYSRKMWRAIAGSKRWSGFFYGHDNLCALQHGDDWPAVKTLREKGQIPDDAVFVPGHTGDFISGGHLQYIFSGGHAGVTSPEYCAEKLIRKHLSLNARLLADPACLGMFQEDIKRFFTAQGGKTAQQNADAYEQWEWRERQAKFIINAVRSYEDWGYEWRVPLWDAEIMHLWSQVPLHYKRDKKLYHAFIAEHDASDVFAGSFSRPKLHRKRRLGVLRRYLDYFRDPKGIYGAYDYVTVSIRHRHRRNVNSIFSEDYIAHVLGKEWLNPGRAG